MIDVATVVDRLGANALDDTLRKLGLQDDDRADALTSIAAILANPDDVGMVAQCACLLAEGVGMFGLSAPDPWERLPSDREDLAIAALVAALPQVLAEHHARGIGQQISWASVADLGQQMSVNRATHGRYGLDTYGWMRSAWSGGLIQLGRMQFIPKPAQHGWVLDTHIPATTPLTPHSVTESFTTAIAFFDEHFPDCPAQSFTCTSWLLDPALATIRPGSNLAQFQQRWNLVGTGHEADSSVLYFAFGKRVDPEAPIDLDSLTPTTSLQRAITEHLRAGNHWYVWTGTLPFDQI